MKQVGALFLVLILSGFASIYPLARPTVRIPWQGSECRVYAVDLAIAHLRRKFASDLASELNRDRHLIYGWQNRLSANAYGLQWNLVVLANTTLNAGLSEPSVPASVAARGAAAVKEISLVGYVADGIGVSRCEAQHWVPETGSDSIVTAERKLTELLRRLR